MLNRQYILSRGFEEISENETTLAEWFESEPEVMAAALAALINQSGLSIFVSKTSGGEVEQIVVDKAK